MHYSGRSVIVVGPTLEAQRDVLGQAEQSLAGYAEGARFLLDAARQSRLVGARGSALSSALDVPAELETAISAALGDTLDAVLFDGAELEDALRLLEADESGRAALLPLQALTNSHALQTPFDPDCIGLASELVRVPPELRSAVDVLLGYTLIVGDRRAARRLIRDLPNYSRVVTLRGEVFRGDGLIIAGKTASTSTLSRPRQKRELHSALSELVARLHESNQAVEQLSNEIAIAQRGLRSSRSARSAIFPAISGSSSLPAISRTRPGPRLRTASEAKIDSLTSPGRGARPPYGGNR